MRNAPVAFPVHNFAEITSSEISLSERSLVVSDLTSESKGSRFETGCYLCAEMSSLQ